MCLSVQPTTLGAQEVEIINGAVRQASPDPTSPGLRVTAFVQPSDGTTVHRVITPLLPEEVLFVQTAVDQAGYELAVRDGVWGPATVAALTAFQGDRRLETCGCVDYPTMRALGLRSRVIQTVIGSPDDESDAEVVLGPARLPPPPAPEEVTAPPETVVVVREGSGYWSYPFFYGFRPIPPIFSPSAGGGVPIGPPLKLGTPRGGPPPR